MAPRFRRNIDRDLPAPDGFGVCRLLSRALSDFVVSDFARHLALKSADTSTIVFGRRIGISFSSFPIFFLRFFSARPRATSRAAFHLMPRAISRWRFSRTSTSAAMSACSTGTRYRLRFWHVVMLAAHGATYLTLKTEGPVHDRSEKYGEVSLDRGCAALSRSPGRIENRASGSAWPRVVQSILVARIDRNCCLNYRACFWPEW